MDRVHAGWLVVGLLLDIVLHLHLGLLESVLFSVAILFVRMPVLEWQLFMRLLVVTVVKVDQARLVVVDVDHVRLFFFASQHLRVSGLVELRAVNFLAVKEAEGFAVGTNWQVPHQRLRVHASGCWFELSES